VLGLVYPIFSLSRQDAKTAKKTLLILLLGALCPVEYHFHRSVIFSFTALFHGASPVEYRRPRSRCSPEALFHRGESSSIRSFPLSLNSICLPRSTRRSRRIYNLISLCVLRALRGDISLLVKQIRDCGRHTCSAKLSAPVTCYSICLPRSTRRSRRIYNQIISDLRFKPCV